MTNQNKRLLIICNAPFQVIVALHILELYYSDAIVDFLVSDQFKGSDQIAKNAQESKRFRNVFYIKSKKWWKKKSTTADKIKYYTTLICSVIQNLFNVVKVGRNTYDTILFTNISVFTKLLCSVLTKRNNNCKIHIFEEGLGTYSQVYAESDSEKSFYRRFIDHKGIFFQTERLYLFHPQFLTWYFPPEKICVIPPLSPSNKSFLNLANQLFKYSNNIDLYDKKVIFFEESYYAEGDDVPDIEIVNMISQYVGKDNIMIKVHPRNPINRFKELGYKTNINNSIPWELIMLNQPIENKIFVTIASGAAINPYLYLGIKVRSYSLLNCLKNRPGIMNTQLGELMANVYATFPEYLKAPTDFDSFITEFSQDISLVK